MIENYLRQKFTEVIENNKILVQQYPYHMFIKHIDLDNKKILHVFNGLNNKKKIVYEALMINLSMNYSCLRNYFYQLLSDNYYIEYLISDCSCLSVFSFIKKEGILKKFYIRRWNFSILPSTKYVLKKLERDPDFLAPLITTTLTGFYEFYQKFYSTVCNLQAALKIVRIA